MIVLCASCAKADQPSFIYEKPPFADSRISHGMCPTHEAEWRAAADRLHEQSAGTAA